MTGAELIKWIKDHHAEEMMVVVQYRDSGGCYDGCNDAAPKLAKIRGTNIPHDDSYDISYVEEDVNAISL